MKSKGILFLFFFFTLFALQGQSVSVWQGGNTTWTNGSGTQVDPYLIESADHLAYLASQTNAGTTYSGTYFKMSVDIDLNGLNWTPIGNSSTYSFQGNFDGDNHTIYQLNIMVSGGSNVYVGLFGYLSNANISKIKIKGGVINVATSGTNYVGTIAGYASATNIDSCGNSANILINNQGTTSAYNSYVGGLVGYMTGEAGDLSNSYNKGELNFTKTLQTSNSTSYSWNSYIGGLVGYLQYSDILNCGNLNQLTVMNNVTTYYKNSTVNVGGVAGYVNASATYRVVIDKSYNRGKLVVNNKAYCTNSNNYYANAYAYIGGITGYHQTGYISITNCYNRGDIEPYVYSYNSSYLNHAYTYVGGISGYLYNATTTYYTNCYHSGRVPATYTPYNQDAGNGYKIYQHGCYAYNPSTVSPTIANCYFQNDCGCTVNSSPYASPLAAFILQSRGMPSTLGLTNWSQDINPRRNGGYPTILGGAYPDLLETLPVTDTTAVSAKLYAIIDTLQVLSGNCSAVGFEYKLQGTATYTSINCALADTFSVVLGGLLPCTTYTVRPYLTTDGYTAYGDTLNFTTLCLPTFQIDTTRCYGDTLHILGENLYPDGTYYKIHN
ncbi:MAG TPA: GLUG motif-containing protein, partial [Bacteroidales bacterium]|nr:GLUG motif-containing protein [Bacteroidales bacterium]